MAANSEKYFWLKLKENFFTSKRIKKLRRLAGGDTYVIIYLKMQLVAMKHDGIIQYTGLERTFAEELALDIDEDPENVAVTLTYLLNTGLAESSDDINFFFPYAVENTGKESTSTERVRAFRDREKQKKLAAIQGETECNVSCNTELEIEKELEIETEKKEKKEKRFTPPTAEEVRAYCQEKKYGIDPEAFIDFYQSKNWKVGKDKMSDWKAAVRTWERRRKEKLNGSDRVPDGATEKKFNIHYDVG